MVTKTWLDFPKDFFGVNANLVSMDKHWVNDSLHQAMTNLGSTTFRYPGGTIGNYWDWDEGKIDDTVPDSLMIRWVVDQGLKDKAFGYDMERLAQITEKTGMTPVFMLNMMSQNLDHSLRNLKKAQELGVPIKYVEMGNELYFNIPFPLHRYPTPESYGQECQEWLEVLKPEFPEAKFAIVGNYLERHDRQVNWNRRVLSTCTLADAVTIHLYGPLGIDGARERKNNTAGLEGTVNTNSATRTSPSTQTERQFWELELLNDPKAVANMFTLVDRNSEKLTDFFVPTDLELWVTEFNIRDDNSRLRGTWAQSLVLMRYYLHFLKEGATLTHIHNVVGGLFPMIYTNTSGFEHIKTDTLQSKPYQLSAAGSTVKLLAYCFKGMEQYHFFETDEFAPVEDDRGDSYAPIMGIRLKNNSTERIVFFNFSSLHQPIQLPQSFQYKEFTSFRAPLGKLINGFEDIIIQQGNHLTLLPPYTIIVVKKKNNIE